MNLATTLPSGDQTEIRTRSTTDPICVNVEKDELRIPDATTPCEHNGSNNASHEYASSDERSDDESIEGDEMISEENTARLALLETMIVLQRTSQLTSKMDKVEWLTRVPELWKYIQTHVAQEQKFDWVNSTVNEMVGIINEIPDDDMDAYPANALAQVRLGLTSRKTVIHHYFQRLRITMEQKDFKDAFSECLLNSKKQVE
jgi:hypothetical protein